MTFRTAELDSLYMVYHSLPPAVAQDRFSFGGPSETKLFERDFAITNLDFAEEKSLNAKAELYDRYLHKQDRAYTTREFYNFVEAAGLHVVKPQYREVFDLEHIPHLRLKKLLEGRFIFF